MVYLALLRGINVGGKNKVSMAALKATFERAGMLRVSTYINSGNVVFGAPPLDDAALTTLLEDAIEHDFGFRVRVSLRDSANLAEVLRTLPEDWADDRDTRCYVLFLPDAGTGAEVAGQLTIKPGIDEVLFAPGAAIWRVERPNVTRSGMSKLLSTDLYRRMTLRNANTVRTLARMVEALDAEMG